MYAQKIWTSTGILTDFQAVFSELSYQAIFFCSTTAKLGPRLPHCWSSHTIRHTHLVGLLWTSGQHITEAATCTTPNKHKKQTSIPLAGFEPTIPAVKYLQTNALDCMATGLSCPSNIFLRICYKFWHHLSIYTWSFPLWGDLRVW